MTTTAKITSAVTLQHNRAAEIMESSRKYAQYLNQVNTSATQLERVITLWSRILSKYQRPKDT